MEGLKDGESIRRAMEDLSDAGIASAAVAASFAGIGPVMRTMINKALKLEEDRARYGPVYIEEVEGVPVVRVPIPLAVGEVSRWRGSPAFTRFREDSTDKAKFSLCQSGKPVES